MTTINNYNLIHTNGFEDVRNSIFKIPNSSFKKEGKLFLHDLLALTSMEISINILKPYEEIPFFHKHKENEEVYIVVKGKVQFIIDEEIIDLKEGSIISIKPDGARYYKNTSSKDELILIVIQAKEQSLNQSSIKDGYLVD